MATRPPLDPAKLAAQLSDGKEIKDIPTFTHMVKNKATGTEQEFTSPIVLQCATSKRWHPVAILEDGAYVKTNEFVGNDRQSKNGFYRIDKEQDALNQSTWRKEKAVKDAAEAEAKKASTPAEVAPAEEAPEAPKAKAPRKRVVKKDQAA